MTTLYLDLETVPADYETAGPLTRAGVAPDYAMAHQIRRFAEGKVKPPSNYGPEAAARWVAKKHAEATTDAIRWWERGSVDPKRGITLCAGYAVNNGPVEAIWGADELATLTGLLHLLDDAQPDRILAWRGDDFDFPWLWERSTILGLPGLARWFPVQHYGARMAAGLPHPRAALIDPRKLWATTRESSDRLRETAQAVGAWHDNPISGGDVLDCMLRGEVAVVAEHVKADVATLRALWRVQAPALGLDRP